MMVSPQQMNQSNKAIKEFVERYHITLAENLAKCVQNICEVNLKKIPQVVQAICTSRAKTKTSLQTKLQRMNESRLRKRKTPFKNREEIKGNVFDLSGVRVALYVPSQKDIVIRELGKWFLKVEWIGKKGRNREEYSRKLCGKMCNESECETCPNNHGTVVESSTETSVTPEMEEIYNPVFAGYVADHARVKLHRHQAEAANLHDWEPDDVVEIQIVSVLLHAWAEVEHDITYKSIKAEAGMAERIILDSLNGIIRSSELLLDQLHMIHTQRIESVEKPFPNKFALAMFLDGYIGGLLSDDAKNNLELKMLFGLLRAVSKDSHQQLHPLLKTLGFKENNKSSDLSMLGEDYSALIKAKKPFPLATHMQLPFYIMRHIVSQLSEDEERKIRVVARGDTPQHSYTCRVLLSSFIWIGQLSLWGSIQGATTQAECKKREAEALLWPFNAPLRFNILVNRGETMPEDVKYMQILWSWFERQKPDSFFSFAFRIARLGVVGSFPDDLNLLTRKDESTNISYPSSSSSSRDSSPSKSFTGEHHEN
jgi:ppGpp synthetase/RelA/SpoT-type nucleotidyltranferase